jgi:sugar transferase (PEP-CTERM/EpsH1 system associated)
MYKKIHVMHLLPNLNIGGMENGVINLLNNGNSDKFQLSLCCLQEEGPLKERIREKNISVYNLNQKSGKQYLLPFKFAYLFRKIKVEIVHTHNFYTGVYGIIGGKIARVPVIIHGEHGGFFKISSMKKNKVKLLLKLCDGILTVSHSLKNEIMNDFPEMISKIHTIINGVDFTKFDMDKNKRKNSNSIVLGSVGRLTPEKDYPTMLQAFKLIHEHNPSTILKIIGYGPLEYELRNLAINMGLGEKVEFLGQRNDVHDLMKSMDIFIMSSMQEGCSNAILEAFAMKLPVVATRVGDNPILLDDGRGILVNAKNTIEFAQAIITLIDDDFKKNSLSEKGYNWVKNNHSINKMVEDYENFYISLYNKKMN